MKHFDAHNHLHDERLAPHRQNMLAELEEVGLAAAVVNGTREEDWASVAALAKERKWVCPAFGLHPWHVGGRSPEWQEQLEEWLEKMPGASVGEIGLDRWIPDHDLAVQQEVFRTQMALARRRELPATVHCLQAWGALEEMTRSLELPSRGWLLHAYGGSLEMAQTLAQRGAYFSFSAYFLHERKAARREVFRSLPLDRLLVETDAPDMLPPAVTGAKFLESAEREPLNAPANIELGYTALAELRGMRLEDLAGQVEENFMRLFG